MTPFVAALLGYTAVMSRPVHRLSSGVVVVRETAEGYRFLMLRAFRNWDFPKGIVECGEEPRAAALREVEEETGIADVDFAWGCDYFEPVEPPPDGDITFVEAKALAKGRITLGGNIESRILELEDAGVVEKAVRRAFAGGKDRMVLQTTAGPLAEISPRMIENYHRLIDVWEELSPV